MLAEFSLFKWCFIGWLSLMKWSFIHWFNLMRWSFIGWLILIRWGLIGWLILIRWGFIGWLILIRWSFIGWSNLMRWNFIGWLTLIKRWIRITVTFYVGYKVLKRRKSWLKMALIDHGNLCVPMSIHWKSCKGGKTNCWATLGCTGLLQSLKVFIECSLRFNRRFQQYNGMYRFKSILCFRILGP